MNKDEHGHDYGGLSTHEVAAQLGLCRSHVDVLTVRAIRQLWRVQVNPDAVEQMRIRSARYQHRAHVTDAMIRAALTECAGQIREAARRLGISHTTIRRRLGVA